MLDKTTEKVREAETAATAIVVQVQTQIGPNRTMSMQFGVPLNMQPADLNRYVDKVMNVADRQNDKGLLEQARIALDRAQKDLQTALEQRSGYEAKCALDFTVSGRRGDWKPNGSEQKQLGNWDATMRNLREVVIPKFKNDIAELEAKIAAGV